MKVKCPTCKKDVNWVESSKHRPFCSKRCQLIDLGEWANEAHTIKGDSTEILESQNIYFE
ncbi:DNA gyrase inhibitor YacG [Psychromonas sp. CD1]|uniref:DNA gyrase inhibitor YacG n=1 Tax=Psychromonas sp. CD1 TaxID=1979839 RepID=UPI000B9C089D|nr:DNA gyrase inhibitor YacG [Psychromonas sp. CD1]